MTEIYRRDKHEYTEKYKDCKKLYGKENKKK